MQLNHYRSFFPVIFNCLTVLFLWPPKCWAVFRKVDCEEPNLCFGSSAPPTKDLWIAMVLRGIFLSCMIFKAWQAISVWSNITFEVVALHASAFHRQLWHYSCISSLWVNFLCFSYNHSYVHYLLFIDKELSFRTLFCWSCLVFRINCSS